MEGVRGIVRLDGGGIGAYFSLVMDCFGRVVFVESVFSKVSPQSVTSLFILILLPSFISS